MQKAVELMTEWGKYDTRYPEASLEDFCRYYLVHRQMSPGNRTPATRFQPHGIDSQLMRLLGRIVKIHSIYILAATDGTGLKGIEDFALLNTIARLGEPRKTEAIYDGLYELSTGADMLNRLKKLGYISEYDDAEDKRSKRLQVTPEGFKMMETCHVRVVKLAEMLLHDLSSDEKKMVFQLLEGVEEKFSGLWQGHKGKDFESIYAEVTSSR